MISSNFRYSRQQHAPATVALVQKVSPQSPDRRRPRAADVAVAVSGGHQAEAKDAARKEPEAALPPLPRLTPPAARDDLGGPDWEQRLVTTLRAGKVFQPETVPNQIRG